MKAQLTLLKSVKIAAVVWFFYNLAIGKKAFNEIG